MPNQRLQQAPIWTLSGPFPSTVHLRLRSVAPAWPWASGPTSPGRVSDVRRNWTEKWNNGWVIFQRWKENPKSTSPPCVLQADCTNSLLQVATSSLTATCIGPLWSPARCKSARPRPHRLGSIVPDRCRNCQPRS